MNITPISLEHPDFNAHEFTAMARTAGLLPQQIVIEVARIPSSNLAFLTARAEALNALGVRLALSNVASDKTGLEALGRMRFAYVKIDHALMKKALTDESARNTIDGITEIARDTGTYVIAEGVENAEVLELACRRQAQAPGTTDGIRGIQGYLLGRPSVGGFDVADLHTWGKFLTAHFIKRAV